MRYRMPASCKGRAKRAIRLGSGSGELTGDDFLAFRFGKIGVGTAGCTESSLKWQGLIPDPFDLKNAY